MDLPPLFEYVRIGDETFEDGGVVDNLPIYFGTGIEKCDLLFVLPLNASFASSVDRRWILRRMQRVLTIRQGALERRALKDVYLYNELAALRGGRQEPSRGSAPSSPRARPRDPKPPSRGPRAARSSSEPRASPSAGPGLRRLPRRAPGNRHARVLEDGEAGRAFRLMREYTRYELERFDFDAGPNWIRVALVGPSGEVRYLEDF